MKKRKSYAFLNGLDPEVSDYIKELEEYLWRVVRVAAPGAGGSLDTVLDNSVKKLERQAKVVNEFLKKEVK